MTDRHDFSALERLMEFGLGLSIAQQMVGTMNQVMQQSVMTGSLSANRRSDQQPFYVVIDGAIGGPWSRQQLQAAFLSGRLTSDTFCWTQGMAQWARAGDIGYFHQPVAPPPMPPVPPAAVVMPILLTAPEPPMPEASPTLEDMP